MGGCTTAVSAEDQRGFLSTQPVHQDSNKPHQGFQHCLRVCSDSGIIMFSGKSRPHPTNQESNTLLWPVDLRFWFCLMLMGRCRWISTHLSSLFLSFSPFPMDQGWSRCSKSLLCKAYHLNRHCSVWFAFCGVTHQPQGYCTDPCMGLF